MADYTRYGNTIEAGGLSDGSYYSMIKSTSDLILKCVRPMLIFYGDPSFTNLRGHIYSNDVQTSAPYQSIATSTNVINLSDVKTTHSYIEKSVPFIFNDVALKGSDTYWFVLSSDAYTPVTDVSFIAWSKAWPDPTYKTNYTPTGGNFLTAPHMIESVYGATL